MERFGKHLAYTMLAVLGGLPAGCAVAGLVLGCYLFSASPQMYPDIPSGLGVGLTMALVAMFLGIAPALLYGAPAYAFMAYRGWANFPSAVFAGTLPGLMLLPLDGALGGLFLLFGIPVACCTHLFVGRRLATVQRQGAG